MYKVIANVVDDKHLRTGAKVGLLSFTALGKDSKCYVYGLSIGGRKIKKWLPLKRIINFRVKWDDRSHYTKEYAESLVKAIEGNR